MKKRFIFFAALSLLLILRLKLATVAYAVCPVCTVAVAGGLGLSRWLGIDDTVTGIWVGGLILSSSFWLSDWIKRKYQETRIKYLEILVIAIMYLLVILPLWFGKIIGHPLNTLWGIDKLVLGTIIGSLAFAGAVWADKKVRETKGKQLFNYQKVLFPVGSLAIISLIFYFLTR